MKYVYLYKYVHNMYRKKLIMLICSLIHLHTNPTSYPVNSIYTYIMPIYENGLMPGAIR